MKHLITLICILAVWLGLVLGCKKSSNKTEPVNDLKFVVPANFPFPYYNFGNNKVTNAGFDLGRRLFFEQALSIDKSISCGSCHQQQAAFANQDRAVSSGINNCQGTRNAFPLFNLAWQQSFMWDGNITDIEVSGRNALTTACEMGNSVDNIVKTLNAMPVYTDMFKKAFGTPEVNADRFFKALTQFTGMMISANSKYDKFKRFEPGGTFTADEFTGYNLFLSQCSTCHTEPLFTDDTFRSNGLDLVPQDHGRELVTGLPADRGKFRIPSLRNVEVTGPYMHDGRFNTLEDVLDHYTDGVMNHENLDPQLKKNTKPGLVITAAEKAQIIAFLKTLTDREFIQDKRFIKNSP